MIFFMLKMEFGHLKCVNSLFKNGQILPRPRILQDAQPALIKAELLFFPDIFCKILYSKLIPLLSFFYWI